MTRIDIACNNPANGLMSDNAPLLSIGDAEFECRGSSPKFAETAKGFRLSGKNWPVISSQDWMGNWCWNRYFLPNADELASLVRWLKERGGYQCTNAESAFYSWFNNPDETASDAELKSMIASL